MAYEKKERKAAGRYQKKDGGDKERRSSYSKGGQRDSRKGPSDRSKPRTGGFRGDRDKPRGRSFDSNRRPGSRDSRPRSGKEYRPREETPKEPQKIRIPQDAARLLYRGIDCQIKGNTNLAMIMFLHGSVMMSEGCQNNAERILKEAGKDRFVSIRSEIGPNCSEDALVEFDYLCIRRDAGYDRTFFDGEYSKRNMHAIFRKICLEEVEGNDPVIDEFASMADRDEAKVIEGLDYLRRKKDSEKAEKHLKRIQDAIELRKSVNVLFTRAMNGDSRAAQELKRHSKDIPEAAFFSEFLSARAEGNQVEWLRSKYPQFKDLIIAKQAEFKIQDDPFGQYLGAKNLESKKEEYMSVMMNAARMGSQEAIDELRNKLFRDDVRKCLAGIYLKEEDLEKLLSVYEAGLDDQYYLDQYCGSDEELVLKVGSALGRHSVTKEMDWLKDHYLKGMDFCRTALIERSKDERNMSKKMVYTLHDVGCDLEAAQLYFELEGDTELPSVKWLKKVCTSDEVTEYVRRHYEETGDLATFDTIFIDDGYQKRSRPRQSGGRPSARKGRR
jgi:hypothetical protein